MKNSVVILTKEDMLGLFALIDKGDQQRLVVVDSRKPNDPAIRQYDDRRVAYAQMRHEVNVSVDRGWQIIYDGQPLWG